MMEILGTKVEVAQQARGGQGKARREEHLLSTKRIFMIKVKKSRFFFFWGGK